jgi:uncharacterized protein involved in exopolysaccharide biosynthesis
MKMINSLQEAASDEVRLFSSGLGDNHPRIRALRSQREIYTQQLSDQLNSVRQNHLSALDYCGACAGRDGGTIRSGAERPDRRQAKGFRL